MKKIILSALILIIFNFSFAQNAFKTYNGIVSETSQTNYRIFDKTLVWFYNSFYKKNVIQLTMVDSNIGIIMGRTIFYSAKKGSINPNATNEEDYADYNFEWTIQIDNSNINFTITNTNKNIDLNKQLSLSSIKIIPVKELEKTNKRIGGKWDLSKSYLISNLDSLVVNIGTELVTSEDDLVWFSIDKTFISQASKSPIAKK